MTNQDALKALLAKVKAGTVRTDSKKAKWRDCDFEQVGYGYRVNANIAKAYNGSVDAALRLKNAVLPGWAWAIRQNTTFDKFHGYVTPPWADEDTYHFDGGFTDSPARALLIAILEALIAEGEG